MKKKLIKSILTLTATAFFFSCANYQNMTVPKSIGVKIDSSYEFAFGEAKMNVGNNLKATKLQKTLSGNSNDENSVGIKVYDYNPTQKDEDVQQYLLYYPITEIPLSVYESSNVESMKFNVPIKLPDFNRQISNNIKIDEKEFPIVETGMPAEIPDGLIPPIELNIREPDYKAITLHSGKMIVSITPDSTATPGFVMNVSIRLEDADGNIIATSGEETTVGSEKADIELDLSSKSFGKTLSLFINGSMTGGTPGNNNKYKIGANISDVKLEKIEGLSLSAEQMAGSDETSIDKDIDLKGISKHLISAQIDDGSITLATKLPDGWTGIGCTLTDLKFQGGIDVAAEDFNDYTGPDASSYAINKTALLKNKTLSVKDRETFEPKSIHVTGKVALTVDDATIVFENGVEKSEIDFEGECHINSLGKLSVDISELGKLEGEVDTKLDLDEIMSGIIKEDDSNLINNLQFAGIDGYIFVTRPETEKLSDLDLNLTGTVEAVYLNDNDEEHRESLIEESSIAVKSQGKSLAQAADENLMITDTSILSNASANLKEETLLSIVNSHPKNLKISYNLGTSGENNGKILDLDGDALVALNEAAEINVSMVIQLPLQVKLIDVTDGEADGFITIDDILSLTGNEMKNDIFSRKKASDSDDWMEYVDLLESLTLNYTFKNSTGFSLSAFFEGYTDPNDPSTLVMSNELTIDGSGMVKSFGYEREEAKNILQSYPVIVKVPVKIQASTDTDDVIVKIPRNPEFGLNGSLKVAFDGTYKKKL